MFRYAGLLVAVALLASGCASRMQSTVFSDRSPLVVRTDESGNYVVQAFSRAGNVLYQGRSWKSGEDALAKAVATCRYSDCKTYVVMEHEACVAFAINDEPTRRWGKGRGKTPEDAMVIAMKYCNTDTVQDTCRPVASLCPAN